ncbi:CocE/NonD family hydrolase [Bryobacter aggregatus]|uniref:CocE/NonD family hydrolase n=1 Tax=Bryobacter aggregatus TaxID=360054 RepID=UPI000AABAF35|nr:CocE/NonD family hydrolase [Bryobacter aggregatus]
MRFFSLLLASALLLAAQGLEYVKANYTKYEYRIAMRDGKKLFTSVYLPKDTSKKYPILLNRTPYSVAPYGEDQYKADIGPTPLFGKDGFIVVYQDVRGKNMSEGEFINMTPHLAKKPGAVDESTDTYDTIDWLTKNLPNNNGRVATWGISYPGFYTAAGMIDAHPALKLASPQAPITDWFVGDDFHHNGALYLPHAFNFLSSFGVPRPEPTVAARTPFDHKTPDGYKFFLDLGPNYNANERYLKNNVQFWTDMMKHPNYDEFWQSRNLRPHLKNIQPAVLTIGGFFDAENLFGAQQVFKNVEKGGFANGNRIVMGPWFHGGWARSDGDSLGDISFNAKTSEWYREKVELPYFKYILKDGPDPNLPKALMFESGSNVWRRYDAWPPPSSQAKSLYFHSNGKLSFTPPTETGASFDEYPSDPAKPVPYIPQVSNRMTREHMVMDQRQASTRPDVLVYVTDELTEDVVLAGPVTPSVFFSTTGTDADVVVKLIDVYPNDFPDPNPNPTGVHMGGYQMMVRGDVFRARFRESYSTPIPFTPGKAEKVEWNLPDVNHSFRKGHRIMVQVQSTWFPLVDRNPQKYVPNINEARESDFQKATHRIYRSTGQASQVKVTIVPGLTN